MSTRNLAREQGAPSHMHWAYAIAENPMAFPEISRRYALDALKQLRLPVPGALKDWSVQREDRAHD